MKGTAQEDLKLCSVHMNMCLHVGFSVSTAEIEDSSVAGSNAMPPAKIPTDTTTSAINKAIITWILCQVFTHTHICIRLKFNVTTVTNQQLSHAIRLV